MKEIKRRQKLRKKIIYFSLLIFPITFYYFSPAIIIMGANEGIVTGSFIIFALMFFGALFLGRAFCGWLCPAAGLQELIQIKRKKRVRTGVVDLIKYLIVWIPWISVIIFFVYKAGGYSKIDFFYKTWHGISVSNIQSLITMVTVLFIIGLIPLIFGRRAFCHYGCWMAPFMVAGTAVRDLLKLPGLRLKVNSDSCNQCKSCTAGCTMSLDVDVMVAKKSMKHHECILCGNCADVCKQDVITFAFKNN